MEEILASIRRIISEEEQTPNAAPVLDLTQTDEPRLLRFNNTSRRRRWTTTSSSKRSSRP